MPRRKRVGLRNRATIGFAFVALSVVIGSSLLTYAVGRRYLLNQRESSAIQQSYVNARLVRTILRGPNPDLTNFLNGLNGGNASSSLVFFRGEWYSASVAVGTNALPPDLVASVQNGGAGHQRSRDSTGALNLVVGARLAATEASYFEVFPLAELDETLSVLRRALLLGASLSALVAAVVGRILARQLVRPLGPVTVAAESIAAGALGTRLDETADPDLDRLSHAFNTMTAALEERIDREARFAADVSHELRTPLTAVAAAVEIMQRRREQLPPEMLDAFNVLAEKISGFQRMVLDLLEISRMDAGTSPVEEEEVEIRPFVRKIAALHQLPESCAVVESNVPVTIRTDRRRLAQAMTNIVDNAGAIRGWRHIAPSVGFARSGLRAICLR